MSASAGWACCPRRVAAPVSYACLRFRPRRTCAVGDASAERDYRLLPIIAPPAAPVSWAVTRNLGPARYCSPSGEGAKCPAGYHEPPRTFEFYSIMWQACGNALTTAGSTDSRGRNRSDRRHSCNGSHPWWYLGVTRRAHLVQRCHKPFDAATNAPGGAPTDRVQRTFQRKLVQR